MTQYDEALRLRHMLEAAQEAVALVEGKTRSDLDGARLLQLALTRLIEIVGEAASRIPVEARAKFAGIPWPQIVGMRNRLVHGYDFIDLDQLWSTVIEDLPTLIPLLEQALADPRM